jgi:hypothetical protein
MDTQLYKTAIHEAGHAVMANRLGAPVEFVSITPRPDDGTLGHSTSDDEVWETDADGAKKRVLSLLAGWAAVRAGGIGNPAQGCAQDFVRASELLQAWKLGSLKRWKRRALAIMRRPENMRAVALVAEKLQTYSRVDGQLFDLIVMRADGEIAPAYFASWEQQLTGERALPA